MDSPYARNVLTWAKKAKDERKAITAKSIDEALLRDLLEWQHDLLNKCLRLNKIYDIAARIFPRPHASRTVQEFSRIWLQHVNPHDQFGLVVCGAIVMCLEELAKKLISMESEKEMIDSHLRNLRNWYVERGNALKVVASSRGKVTEQSRQNLEGEVTSDSSTALDARPVEPGAEQNDKDTPEPKDLSSTSTIPMKRGFEPGSDDSEDSLRVAAKKPCHSVSSAEGRIGAGHLEEGESPASSADEQTESSHLEECKSPAASSETSTNNVERASMQ